MSAASSYSRADSAPFLPMTQAEMAARGWQELDVLLVTGDAYVDHPSFGAAVIGRVLEADGWRVGIVAQPDWRSPAALQAMGRPRLFCGVTAGNLDSMLANYSAARHHRREDAYTENRAPGKRPNHAAVVYAQLCRQAFPGVPVVLGGIEASLRRVTHYDYWEDKLKPSILADAKADLLVYGMGEAAIREIARRLAAGRVDLDGIRGTAVMLGAKATAAGAFGEHERLPSWEELQQDKNLLRTLTRQVERQENPYCGKRLVQFHGARAVVIEPAALPLGEAELDAIYELPFRKAPHPSYRGEIPAFTMIKDSITVMRGCAGGCTFCAIGMHQGKFHASRSAASVQREVARMAATPEFRGTISDLGGPTANLYGCENGVEEACRVCRRPSCLFPRICPVLKIDEARCLEIMRAARQTPRVKHVFIQSGVRMDVALRTPAYVKELVAHHVSGHLKVAPEHLHPEVLRRMRKTSGVFEAFQEQFREETRAVGKEQYLVPYFISSFPGCTEDEMGVVERFLRKSNWNLQQVQDFIPLPMTPSAAMYVTGLDYDTGEPIPVVRGAGERQRQKDALHPNAGRPARGGPSGAKAPGRKPLRGSGTPPENR
ncbi:MAG: YgiQ family radical SAM protein [Opitutae bacterium]|nr:YgiQ family radical SAM protein [Opitutae bacterium]